MGSLTTAIPTVLQSVSPALGQIVQFTDMLGNNAEKEAKNDLVAKQKLALRQLQQKQNAELGVLQGDINLDRQKVAVDAQAAEQDRLAALRRAMARQRTQFASQGITDGTGSSQAVLLGLFDESEEESKKRQRLDDIRNRALDQELSSRNSLNVLQRSQLRETQRLQKVLSGF